MSRVPRPLTVEKRKWAGPVSARWDATLLVQDGSRLAWLTEADATRQRPARGQVEAVAHTELSFACDEWWVATAYLGEDGAVERWKVDAATPVVLTGGSELHFTDLDLDIVVDGDAPAGRLLDREVFERRMTAQRYPLRIRGGAEEGIAAARRRIERAQWPFDGSVDALLSPALAGLTR